MTVCQSRFMLADAQVKHYNEHGYVIVKRLFLPSEVEPLKEAIEADGGEVYSQSASQVKYGDGTGFKLSVWSELGNSFLGVFPRISRLVESAEALNKEECYHWHSKIVVKNPGEGNVEWHQGFGTWYEDTCLYPNIVSCCVAINDHTRENGCLQVIKGSHHLGRMENIILPDSNSSGVDPERLKIVRDRLETVYCELDQGDAVFFHANTLHGSDLNTTNGLRIGMFSSYNAASNEPYDLSRQMHHRYVPIEKLSDSVLADRQYDGIFETQEFFPVEEDDESGFGVSVRLGRTKRQES